MQITNALGIKVKVHNRHPLNTKGRPGPKRPDPRNDDEAFLKDANMVMDLIQQKVIATHAPAIPTELKKKKRLTADDEKLLARQYHTFGDIESRNVLVEKNMGLVHMIAHKERVYGIKVDDMITAGVFGLMHAVDMFDPDRDIRFSTYCVYWIRAKIQRHKQYQDKHNNLNGNGFQSVLDANGHRKRLRNPIASLDAPINEDGDALGETVQADTCDPDVEISHTDLKVKVRTALKEIEAELKDPRISVIIKERLLAEEGEEKTLHELGDTLSLSREGVRLLENKVLKKLKSKLADQVAELL